MTNVLFQFILKNVFDDTVSVSCPAKINLGLKVYPRREDGYHDIESIFTAIPLCDELEVCLTDKIGCCEVSCDSMELPEKNTVTSAYEAFGQIAGINLPGVRVRITKKIPSGGGLGGGSSDAAGFLKSLDLLCRTELSIEAFERIASKVGSDVFFFLHCGSGSKGCAVVTSRGENVKNILQRTDLYFLLIFPGVQSSTKEAYALVDEYYESGKNIRYPELEELESVYNGPVKDWTFVNTFTGVISEKYPIIRQAIAELRQHGALFADMSGSGSTVFGVFESAQAAQKAQKALESNWLVYPAF